MHGDLVGELEPGGAEPIAEIGAEDVEDSGEEQLERAAYEAGND